MSRDCLRCILTGSLSVDGGVRNRPRPLVRAVGIVPGAVPDDCDSCCVSTDEQSVVAWIIPTLNLRAAFVPPDLMVS